jgi:hypothetical protein
MDIVMETPMKTPTRHKKTRGFNTIKRKLGCGRYKNMKDFKTPIALDFIKTKKCHVCNIQFHTPRGNHTIRDAIDHNHETENDMMTCSYRGRLCMKCNTTEGVALKVAKKKGLSDHTEIWAKYRNITPSVCRKYLKRNIHTIINNDTITPISHRTRSRLTF